MARPSARTKLILALLVTPNAVTAFVQQSVMVRAQQHEVADAGFSTVDPVIHVMRFDEARAMAARERAVPIARQKRAPDRRRNRSLLAADTERRTALVLRHDDDTGIACKTLDRFERRVGPTRPSMEGCFVDSW
jgi:hypothetical protein